MGTAPPNGQRPDADGERPTGRQPQAPTGVPRQPNGPNTLDMLLSHVDDGLQDEPELTEDLWYSVSDVVGPGNIVDSDPEKGPV